MNASINNINERDAIILGVIKDVNISKQTVRDYFSTHDVSFTIRQYYRYLKKYNEEGVKGLYDRRSEGNAKKFTSEVEHYLIGLLENKQELKVSDIRSRLWERFNIDIKRTPINDYSSAFKDIFLIF